MKQKKLLQATIVFHYIFNRFLNNPISTYRNVLGEKRFDEGLKALWGNLLEAISSLKEAGKVNPLWAIDRVGNLGSDLLQPLGCPSRSADVVAIAGSLSQDCTDRWRPTRHKCSFIYKGLTCTNSGL